MSIFFFFQAEDGIRDYKVTGVQTCALPIFASGALAAASSRSLARSRATWTAWSCRREASSISIRLACASQIGRAACRGRGEISGGAGSLKKKKKNERE